MTTTKPRPAEHIGAGRTGFPSGGAEGIRTPGLLIAKAFRLQTAVDRVLPAVTAAGVSMLPLQGRVHWGYTLETVSGTRSHRFDSGAGRSAEWLGQGWPQAITQ